MGDSSSQIGISVGSIIWVILAVAFAGYAFAIAGWAGVIVVFLGFVLVSISSLIGFIPIIGIFAYWYWLGPAALDWVKGIFNLSSQQMIALHPIFFLILLPGLIFSIVFTIISIVAVVAAFTS